MESILLSASILPIVIPLLIELICVIRGGKVVKHVFICWGLLICGSIISALIIPFILHSILAEYHTNKEEARRLMRLFPEAQIIMFAIFTGWCNSLIIAGIAIVIRKALLQFRRPR